MRHGNFRPPMCGRDWQKPRDFRLGPRYRILKTSANRNERAWRITNCYESVIDRLIAFIDCHKRADVWIVEKPNQRPHYQIEIVWPLRSAAFGVSYRDNAINTFQVFEAGCGRAGYTVRPRTRRKHNE